MELYVEWPNCWLNVAFIVACLLCLLIFICRNLSWDEKNAKEILNSVRFEVFLSCVSKLIALAIFIWIEYELKTYSSADFVNWNMLGYTIAAAFFAIMALCVADGEIFRRKVSWTAGAFLCCLVISLVGTFFLLLIHFSDIFYIIGLLVISLIGVCFDKWRE